MDKSFSLVKAIHRKHLKKTLKKEYKFDECEVIIDERYQVEEISIFIFLF
jgi:hypothetical protein